MAVNLVLNQWVTVWTKNFTYTGFSGRLECQAQLTSQDVSTNKSTVHYWLGVYPDDYKYGESSNTTIDLTGASTWTGYLKIGNGTASQSYTTLRNSTVTLSHNADGTLTTTVAGSFSQVYYSGTLSVSSSGQATLPTIPRASVPTLSASSVVLGNSVTVYTNRASSSFTHTVTFVSGNYTYQIGTAKGVGASVSFNTSNVESSMMSQLGYNTKSKSCTIRVETFNGNTSLGTKTVSLTVVVNVANHHPVITIGTVTDTNTVTEPYHADDAYIANASMVHIPATVSVYGSYEYLASASISFDNFKKETTFSSSTTSGSFYWGNQAASTGTEIVAKVTDTRGNSISATKTITRQEYDVIMLSSVTVNRPVATAGNITLTVKGQAYSGLYTHRTSGNVRNSVTISTQYKDLSTSGSSWVDGDTYTLALSNANGMQNFTFTQTLTETYDYDKQYSLKVTVTDLFSKTAPMAKQATVRIYEGLPVFGWGKTHFDVFGTLHLHDRTDTSKQSVITAAPIDRSSLVDYTSYCSNVYMYQYGRIMFLKLNLLGTTPSGSWTTIATVPSAYRPAMDIALAAQHYNTNNTTKLVWVLLRSDGLVRAYLNSALSATTSIVVCTGTWMI